MATFGQIGQMVWPNVDIRSSPTDLTCQNLKFFLSIEELNDDMLPECQEITKQAIPFNDYPRTNPEWESMGSRYNGFSISPYILSSLVGMVVLGFLIIVLIK